ncbi:uncharacterized protein LOC110018406 isoform X2 [Phalaenopsis equestris]|uniref:uncharacterized protein LOC110018406 isoform X2 n=1 Tax=Phalaenopsis equestris TaxID=78828 RepID=UPI0009E2631B|nr:uncharacterized protein LOC110018406 isoform X2 [Phalaenopsis equestris]
MFLLLLILVAHVILENFSLMDGSIVEVIGSKGCSRLFFSTIDSITSIRSMKSSEFLSSSLSTISGSVGPAKMGPFTGLVICVTGLSKEARQQVMAAAERLGGQYSSTLHPKCTHLVVQSCVGRKFEHAWKYGQRSRLFVVTLGWFVDSVRKNMRLNESLYIIKNVGEHGFPLVDSDVSSALPGTEKSCLPLAHIDVDKSSNRINQTGQLCQQPLRNECSSGSLFSNDFIFIDPDVSVELKKKVVDAASREGAKFLDHWFIGSPASHIVCESPSIQKYIGYANSLVTPLWVFKTVKEKCLQRLVHLSSDLVRQVATILENNQINQIGKETHEGLSQIVSHSWNFHVYGKYKDSLEERQKCAELAKMGVRNRRSRCMQMPLHPITPSSLLESVCWSVSEPTFSASIFTESSEIDDANSVFYDARGDGRDSEASIESCSRVLRESERSEVIFRNHFLTILFPVDRFGELGPSSRAFFSDGGFTRLQVLDHIYNFYQENMSADEIKVAIHTDSRHADRLRSLYASKEAIEQGFVLFRRLDFLGSRRHFEALKRISGQNNSNCYELLLRA